MVVASGGYMQNASDSSHNKNMSATGILICHDNSYPFQERTLSLEQPIKIGRSVARARASSDNAIFDCKVLSRNHALLWYDSGKFYLKDTKSSNGTFVNNKRLSPSGDESIACEVCSGDVVQFGVDVVESTKKVTHGCIIATLKLFLPDGKEAKASASNSVAYVNVTLEDLYKLNQFIQEAGRRENALKSKLEYMQQLLEHTRIAANQSWKALILEDCLLSRLEMLESQVAAYSKNFGDDKLRMELRNLLEDKVQYQNATKELLQKKVQEKREIIGKVQILKCLLSETEEETQSLHNVIKENQNELQELAVKYIKLQQTLQETTDKLTKTRDKLKEVMQQSDKDKQDYFKIVEDQRVIEKNLQVNLSDTRSDGLYIRKQISSLRNYMQTLQDIEYWKMESFDILDHANPIDAMNIILGKWNSNHMKVLKTQIKTNYEQWDKVNYMDIHTSPEISCYTDNNKIQRIKGYSDTAILKNDQYHYILPPLFDQTPITLTNNLQITDPQLKSNNDSHLLENNNHTIKLSTVDESKEQIAVSKFDESFNDMKQEIASIKLIMRFSNNMDDNFDDQIFKNVYELKTDNSVLENSSNKSMSSDIFKTDQVIKNIADRNEDTVQNQEKLETVPISIDNSIVEAVMPLRNYHCLNSCFHDFMLQYFVCSLNSPTIDNDEKYEIFMKEFSNFKHWLKYESKEAIIRKLKLHYYHIEKDAQNMQELSEQLVIFKERYNASVEEISNINKKYINLEIQCKNFTNTSCMVPLYYIAPLLFVLIWMLLEKLM